MTAFDLTPPTDAQRTALIAGLSEDERQRLIDERRAAGHRQSDDAAPDDRQ